MTGTSPNGLKVRDWLGAVIAVVIGAVFTLAQLALRAELNLLLAHNQALETRVSQIDERNKERLDALGREAQLRIAQIRTELDGVTRFAHGLVNNHSHDYIPMKVIDTLNRRLETLEKAGRP
jgi:hypothetical protein